MSPENIKKRFVSLYNSEVDGLFRYCMIRTSSRETAVDLSQESFMRLWDAMSKGQDLLNERAFLYTIARNLIIDWYRKKKSISLESLTDEENGESDFLDRLVLENGSREIEELNAEGRYFIEKIKELDQPYQQVVFLRFVEDLKPKEIAEILGESVNVVSVRISRGVEKMKELLIDKKDKKNG